MSSKRNGPPPISPPRTKTRKRGFFAYPPPLDYVQHPPSLSHSKSAAPLRTRSVMITSVRINANINGPLRTRSVTSMRINANINGPTLICADQSSSKNRKKTSGKKLQDLTNKLIFGMRYRQLCNMVIRWL